MINLNSKTISRSVIESYKMGEARLNTKQSTIILSVYRDDVDGDTNYANHVVLLSRIQDLEHSARTVEVQGLFGGRVSNAICLTWSQTMEAVAKLVCRDYQQEHYIVIDSNGLGSTHSPETGRGHIAELGMWQRAASRREADRHGDWIGIGNAFYIFV